MLRSLLALAASAGALALAPGAALAATAPAATPTRGVVIAATGKAVRLALPDRSVRTYALAARHPRLRAGESVGLAVRHGRATRVRVLGHRRSVTFLARAMRGAGGSTVLRLGDGRPFAPAGASAAQRTARRTRSRTHAQGRSRTHAQGRSRTHARARAAAVTVSVEGLRPGAVVLVTLTFSGAGDLNVALRIVGQAAAPGALAGDVPLQGAVTARDDDAGTLTVTTADGTDHVLAASEDVLAVADPQVCDVVRVAYHGEGDAATADDVQVVGSSEQGDCADQGADDDQVDGQVTSVSATALVLALADGSTETFAADDPSVLDGVAAGDQVEVSYYVDTDGTLVADEVDRAGDATGGDGGTTDGGTGDTSAAAAPAPLAAAGQRRGR